MNNESVPIGSKLFWVLLKLYQFFLFVFVPVLWMLKPAPVAQIPFLFFLFIGIFLIFDIFAVGTASERGITFRRYFREDSAPWREIEQVRWSPKMIRIKLRDRHILRRYLHFPLTSTLRDGIAFTFGRPVAEPAFIAWLRASGCVEEQKIAPLRRI